MAEDETRRITVILKEESVENLSKWKKQGLSITDIVRLAFSLLPDSPNQIRKPLPSLKEIKLTKREDLKVKPKDEEEALKTLQEW